MEHDHDEVQVHEGRPAGTVLSVRLGPDDAKLLMELRARHGGTLSDIVRQGLRALAERSSSGGAAYTAPVATETAPGEFNFTGSLVGSGH